MKTTAAALNFMYITASKVGKLDQRRMFAAIAGELIRRDMTFVSIDGEFVIEILKRMDPPINVEYVEPGIMADPLIAPVDGQIEISWGVLHSTLTNDQYLRLYNLAANDQALAIMAFLTRSNLCSSQKYDRYRWRHPSFEMSTRLMNGIPKLNDIGYMPGIGMSICDYKFEQQCYIINVLVDDAAVDYTVRKINDAIIPGSIVYLLLPRWDDMCKILECGLTKCQWTVRNDRIGRYVIVARVTKK